MKVYQCAVMGSGGVGKSAVTVRFINGSYLEWYDPTNRKQFSVDDQACLLEILDTAGIDQYLTLNDLFIRESEGFVLVFSLAQRESLDEVVRLKDTIYRIKLPPPELNVPMVLVGNKSDLVDEREVSPDEGDKLGIAWGCRYYETSARTNTGILPVFEEMVRRMRAADLGRPERQERRRRGRKCVVL